MNDLTALLELAAGPAPDSVDVRRDVSRGHRALARVRLRHRATGAVGIAAVGAATFGALQLREPAPSPGVATSTPGAPRVAPVRLVAQQLVAGYYTFATTPAGWAVQSLQPSAVVIAPTDGSVSA
ncbi:MAG: hypothetical protein JWO46_2903, partial [Nocardioidaceae bacterium]|nr:hypothetical protein [Nocardioidaceae bacterium]